MYMYLKMAFLRVLTWRASEEVGPLQSYLKLTSEIFKRASEEVHVHSAMGHFSWF